MNASRPFRSISSLVVAILLISPALPALVEVETISITATELTGVSFQTENVKAAT